MTIGNPKVQKTLDWMTRKWWFIVVFILLDVFIPPFATKPYDPSKMGEVIPYIIGHSLFASGSLSLLYPAFKIIPAILIFALLFFGNRFSRVFSLYVGINYILFAVLQYISISDTYGVAVVSGNFILTLVVSLSWLREFVINNNDFTLRKASLLRLWVVPLAFLAFWFPLNGVSMKPDFNLHYVFTNSVGLAFCNMTPVYLAMLILCFPSVNLVTLRLTSLLGVIIGCWNLLVGFVMHPDVLWWFGVLHLPLVFISIYGLVLSLKRAQGTSSATQ